jgi:hypothetical protein
VAIKNILKYNPDAKFIVSLRNPIQMAYSLHSERLFQGRETISDFERAWHEQENRMKGLNIPDTVKGEPGRILYGKICKLGEQVERLLNYVDRQKILFIKLDDLKKDPRSEYIRIENFLNIPDDHRKEFPALNKSKISLYPKVNYYIRLINRFKKKLGIKKEFGIKSMILNLFTKRENRKKLNEKIKLEMKEYFYEDIKKLEAVTGYNLSEWK